MDNTEGSSQPKEPGPKIIGLTGGIGSGKTTVARLFEQWGCVVYYSDDRAKAIVNDHDPLRQDIIKLLGTNAYTSEGFYNRKYVSGKVFEDSELLHQLNALIHPAVRQDFESWVKRQTAELVFKETALLFELSLDEACDASLLITAEDKMRLKRVMDRDGKTYRQVETVMNQQMPEKDKIKRATYVLYNNDGLAELEKEAFEILQKIKTDLL